MYCASRKRFFRPKNNSILMNETNILRKKILHEAYVGGIVDKNAPLFQRMHLKKSTIDYALNKLQIEGFFTKTKYEVDLNALGLGNFAWVLLKVNWENYDEEDFTKKLLKMTQVISVSTVTGESDIAIKIFGSSINNISAFILMLEKHFGDTISETKVYFANKEHKRHYVSIERKNVFKMGEVDCAILNEKMNNPKVSIQEISAKYGVHRNTISKKWENFWKKGVILKELPDLTQKGYDELKMGLKALILIKPAPGHEEKIIRSLVKNRETQDIFTTLSNEIIVILRTENSQTLSQTYKSITNLKHAIKRTSTSIFLTKCNKTSLSLVEINGLIRSRGE
jgi:DNA-binding Lrp family transcriptional regulator